jgi:voltage-gated potassium channel
MRRRLGIAGALRVLLVLAVMVVLYYRLPFDRTGLHRFNRADAAFALFGIVGLAALITWQARSLLTGGRAVRIENLAILLAVIVLFFSILYLRLADQFSGLSTKTDALYFTMATIGTVGFGDVHASGQTARALVTIQMAFDLVYVAALANVFAQAARARATKIREEQQRRNGPPAAGSPAAGSPDAGPPDAGPPDAGSPDVRPPAGDLPERRPGG